MSFDLKTKVFHFEFRLDPAIETPAGFFVPDYQYPAGYQVEAPHGHYEIVRAEQKLKYYPQEAHSDHSISLKKLP